MIVLEATDDFLTKRVQGLPQSDAEKMLYTQEEFVSHLTTYRQLSASYDSAADYFDELEIHPVHFGTVLCFSSKHSKPSNRCGGSISISIALQVVENEKNI